MTHDEVATLREGDVVTAPRAYSRETTALRVRGRVCQLTENFIRVDWVDSRHSYDILRRTSPLWSVVEKEQ
jgi:hypothetical protein